MQHAFTGNTHTAPAETLISNRIIYDLHWQVKSDYVTNPMQESREDAAYGIFHDYLNDCLPVTHAIIAELRRLYPDQANNAELAHHERTHDL